MLTCDLGALGDALRLKPQHESQAPLAQRVADRLDAVGIRALAREPVAGLEVPFAAKGIRAFVMLRVAIPVSIDPEILDRQVVILQPLRFADLMLLGTVTPMAIGHWRLEQVAVRARRVVG